MSASPELAFAFVKDGAIVGANAAFLALVKAGSEKELKDRSLEEWVHGLEIVSEQKITLAGVQYTLYAVRDGAELSQKFARVLAQDRMLSVGSLAAGVAHEINNPLSYVIGNLTFLAEESNELFGDRGEAIEALQEAREGADRVRQIVRDLQTFARADHQVSRSVDVRRVVELAINMAWIEIRHRARLVKEYGDVPPVEGSEARLGQVFLSLLLNSAHQLPEGAADKHQIRVSTAQHQGRAIVEIADTGALLTDEQRRRLFDPFSAAGVGLSIAQTIVQDLGGEISVEAGQGSGTVYRVSLPTSLARKTPPEMPMPTGLTPAGTKGRVLIVDDEPLIASSLKRTLKDHEVTVVSSGRAAIDVLEKDSGFDLIFCDLMMPELTGMDVYDWLRASRSGVEERMVFMTGGTFTQRAGEFLTDVPNMRFEKPFELDQVRFFVRDYIAALRQKNAKRSASDT